MSKKDSPAENATGTANRYVKWKDLSKLRFLVLVPDRDTPRFQSEFAAWLAEECTIALVRACFETEPEKQFNRRRMEAWAPIAPLLSRLQQEQDPSERRRIRKEMERIIPKAKQERITRDLHTDQKKLLTDYKNKLIERLSKLPAYSQVDELNRHLNELRAKGIIPAAHPPVVENASNCPPLPPVEVEPGFATQTAALIMREEVEWDFYYRHPKYRKDKEIADRLTFGEELGEVVARHFARPEVPEESHLLTQIAHALAGLPNPGPNPSPVWASLCDFRINIDTPSDPKSVLRNRVHYRLEAEYKSNPKRLREALQNLLLSHLHYLLPPRHRGKKKSDFRRTKELAQKIRDTIRSNFGQNRESQRNLREIHRAARHDPKIRTALEKFFFPFMTPEDRRCNRSLVCRLVLHGDHADVKHLLDFLLLERRGRPMGLIPLWIKIHAPGSTHRLKKTQAEQWQRSVAQRRSGKKASEIDGQIMKLAGVPENQRSSAQDLGRAARQRERNGLKFPR